MAFNEQSGAVIEGVVHQTMNETIDGVKTFLQHPIVPNETYGGAWTLKLEPPTKSAVFAKMETKADIAAVVLLTGNQSIAGLKTFTSNVTVPYEVYGASWSTALQAPTKKGVYEKMETKADNVAVVLLAGNQSITGTKTFVPTTTFANGAIVPGSSYAGWGGNLTVPNRDELYAIIEGKDLTALHKAGAETVSGVKTFSVDPIVPGEVYGAGWLGSFEPATKHDVYTKIQAMTSVTPQLLKLKLIQAGVAIPTGAIAVNTLGEAPVYGRNSPGFYEIGMPTLFPFTAKTIVTADSVVEGSAADKIKVEVFNNRIAVYTRFNNSLVDLQGSVFIGIEVWP